MQNSIPIYTNKSPTNFINKKDEAKSVNNPPLEDNWGEIMLEDKTYFWDKEDNKYYFRLECETVNQSLPAPNSIAIQFYTVLPTEYKEKTIKCLDQVYRWSEFTESYEPVDLCILPQKNDNNAKSVEMKQFFRIGADSFRNKYKTMLVTDQNALASPMQSNLANSGNNDLKIKQATELMQMIIKGDSLIDANIFRSMVQRAFDGKGDDHFIQQVTTRSWQKYQDNQLKINPSKNTNTNELLQKTTRNDKTPDFLTKIKNAIRFLDEIGINNVEDRKLLLLEANYSDDEIVSILNYSNDMSLHDQSSFDESKRQTNQSSFDQNKCQTNMINTIERMNSEDASDLEFQSILYDKNQGHRVCLAFLDPLHFSPYVNQIYSLKSALIDFASKIYETCNTQDKWNRKEAFVKSIDHIFAESLRKNIYTSEIIYEAVYREIPLLLWKINKVIQSNCIENNQKLIALSQIERIEQSVCRVGVVGALYETLYTLNNSGGLHSFEYYINKMLQNIILSVSQKLKINTSSNVHTAAAILEDLRRLYNVPIKDFVQESYYKLPIGISRNKLGEIVQELRSGIVIDCIVDDIIARIQNILPINFLAALKRVQIFSEKHLTESIKTDIEALTAFSPAFQMNNLSIDDENIVSCQEYLTNSSYGYLKSKLQECLEIIGFNIKDADQIYPLFFAEDVVTFQAYIKEPINWPKLTIKNIVILKIMEIKQIKDFLRLETVYIEDGYKSNALVIHLSPDYSISCSNNLGEIIDLCEIYADGCLLQLLQKYFPHEFYAIVLKISDIIDLSQEDKNLFNQPSLDSASIATFPINLQCQLVYLVYQHHFKLQCSITNILNGGLLQQAFKSQKNYMSLSVVFEGLSNTLEMKGHIAASHTIPQDAANLFIEMTSMDNPTVTIATYHKMISNLDKISSIHKFSTQFHISLLESLNFLEIEDETLATQTAYFMVTISSPNELHFSIISKHSMLGKKLQLPFDDFPMINDQAFRIKARKNSIIVQGLHRKIDISSQFIAKIEIALRNLSLLQDDILGQFYNPLLDIRENVSQCNQQMRDVIDFVADITPTQSLLLNKLMHSIDNTIIFLDKRLYLKYFFILVGDYEDMEEAEVKKLLLRVFSTAQKITDEEILNLASTEIKKMIDTAPVLYTESSSASNSDKFEPLSLIKSSSLVGLESFVSKNMPENLQAYRRIQELIMPFLEADIGD